MFAKPLPKLPIPTLITAAVVWGLCWYFLDNNAAFKLGVVYAIVAGFFLYLRPDYPVSKTLLFLLLLCVLPLFITEQIERFGFDEYQDAEAVTGQTLLLLSVFFSVLLLRRNHQAAMRIEAAQANFFQIRTDHLYELIAFTSIVFSFALLGTMYVLLQWQTDWLNKLMAALLLGGFSMLCWHIRQKQIKHYQATQSQGGEWVEITDIGIRWQQLQNGLQDPVVVQHQLAWAQIQRLDLYKNTVIVEAFEPKTMLKIHHFGPFRSANNLLKTLVKLKYQA